MYISCSTIGMVGAVAGGLAAYFNSPEIQQMGEVVRLGAAVGVGTGTGVASYLASRVCVELLEGFDGLAMGFALAASIYSGVQGHKISDLIAGNIVTEMTEQKELAEQKSSGNMGAPIIDILPSFPEGYPDFSPSPFDLPPGAEGQEPEIFDFVIPFPAPDEGMQPYDYIDPDLPRQWEAHNGRSAFKFG